MPHFKLTVNRFGQIIFSPKLTIVLGKANHMRVVFATDGYRKRSIDSWRARSATTRRGSKALAPVIVLYESR